MTNFIERLPERFFAGFQYIVSGIFDALNAFPDILATPLKSKCPHCFEVFYKWQIHPCEIVDTETKRYPRYLYEEVWNLQDYEKEHPKEGIEALLEHAAAMTRLTGMQVEEASKMIQQRISAITDKEKASYAHPFRFKTEETGNPQTPCRSQTQGND